MIIIIQVTVYSHESSPRPVSRCHKVGFLAFIFLRFSARDSMTGHINNYVLSKHSLKPFYKYNKLNPNRSTVAQTTAQVTHHILECTYSIRCSDEPI